jgi:hypothetical protein
MLAQQRTIIQLVELVLCTLCLGLPRCFTLHLQVMLAQQRTIIQLVELVNVLHDEAARLVAALTRSRSPGSVLHVGLLRVLDLLFHSAPVGDAGTAAHHYSACEAGQRAVFALVLRA